MTTGDHPSKSNTPVPVPSSPTPALLLPPGHPANGPDAERKSDVCQRFHELWGIYPWELVGDDKLLKCSWSTNLLDRLLTLAQRTTLEWAQPQLIESIRPGCSLGVGAVDRVLKVADTESSHPADIVVGHQRGVRRLHYHGDTRSLDTFLFSVPFPFLFPPRQRLHPISGPWQCRSSAALSKRSLEQTVPDTPTKRPKTSSSSREQGAGADNALIPVDGNSLHGREGSSSQDIPNRLDRGDTTQDALAHVLTSVAAYAGSLSERLAKEARQVEQRIASLQSDERSLEGQIADEEDNYKELREAELAFARAAEKLRQVAGSSGTPNSQSVVEDHSSMSEQRAKRLQNLRDQQAGVTSQISQNVSRYDAINNEMDEIEAGVEKIKAHVEENERELWKWTVFKKMTIAQAEHLFDYKFEPTRNESDE
ncbi:hypothetical protein EKO27_g11959 [Xylaria grammica]|uniref:Uncharacterized protein n=1 Tax=Xylaria grammica TaxID=363999 RepID=A0A439CLW1_9PEZI|nr:hypothetical protein EKO27_g11959 [Xylaria grammica]